MTRCGGAACAAFGLLLATLAGCAPRAPDPAPPPAAAASSAAFDGRYTMILRPAGSATGIDPQECAPEPRIPVEVRGGRFTFTLRHPRLARDVPNARDLAAAAYNVAIAADGGMRGESDTGATMTGRAEAGRMSGNIYGLLCYYSFTAARI